MLSALNKTLVTQFGALSSTIILYSSSNDVDECCANNSICMTWDFLNAFLNTGN